MNSMINLMSTSTHAARFVLHSVRKIMQICFKVVMGADALKLWRRAVFLFRATQLRIITGASSRLCDRFVSFKGVTF